ncbi:hypothetical protein [uncultured Gammaproteobacteria bacterium]|jgi:gamma-glutamylcyclotransferase (GGCT)/AIG2-like uncharacterized protein YtfP|nr:hypothetical protein [uncultured Gammaproteobacteria bacterium]
MKDSAILLFSYGTLQNTPVQIKTFGRELTGYDDQLLDYKLEMIAIKDQKVVELSREARHPIAVVSQSKRISGKVFVITAEELAQSDQYEVADYQRVLGKMASGTPAWAYVAAKVLK